MLDAREVRSLLARHGLDARRALGQHFVADPSTVERIAAAARLGPGDHVVEVGPGLGSLTLALAATGASVLAVEKDRWLLPVLADVLGSRDVSGVEILEADATALDWEAVLRPRHDGRWSLVANLPYNVAVPIVVDVLASASCVHQLVVMVQREVAERLVATPGGRTVGVPSMRVGWFASAEVVDHVPPEVFEPPPRVDSAVVRIVRRPPPSRVVGVDEVMALVVRAYRQRRKMLRATLGSVVSAEQFAAAGVEPTARPERLDVAQWARLAEAVQGTSPGPGPAR